MGEAELKTRLQILAIRVLRLADALPRAHAGAAARRVCRPVQCAVPMTAWHYYMVGFSRPVLATGFSRWEPRRLTLISRPRPAGFSRASRAEEARLKPAVPEHMQTKGRDSDAPPTEVGGNGRPAEAGHATPLVPRARRRSAC